MQNLCDIKNTVTKKTKKQKNLMIIWWGKKVRQWERKIDYETGESTLLLMYILTGFDFW